MYYITINVQYVCYSTGRKIKYFIVYRLSFRYGQHFGTVTIFYGSGSDVLKVRVPVPVPTFEFRFRFQLHI